MSRPAASAPAASPPPARDLVSVAAASLLAIAAAAAQYGLLRDLKQLPSPLMGGDYTYQAGCVRSILASGNPMASCSCTGALPGYLPLYGTLSAALVRITGLPVERAMFALSILAHAASALAVAWVVGRHVGVRAGVVVTCVWAVLYEHPVLRYTEFTAQVLVPFYFDALLRYLREPRPRHAAYLALVLAPLGYAHAVAFVAAVMVTGLSSLVVLASRRRSHGLPGALRHTAWEMGIAGAGAALALGYWYRPLFAYHGRTSLHYVAWNGGPYLELWVDKMAYARSLLAGLLNLVPPAEGALHALFLVGAATLLVSTSTRRRFAGVAVAAAATFAWMFHFFLSMPILHTHFIPGYVGSTLWAFVLALVAGVPVALALERLPRRAGAIAVAVALAAAWAGLALGARSLAKQDLMVAARQPLPPAYQELARWVEAHTGPDDVALSANELSFAWAALTGRKTLVSRRAQNDGFLDIDERNRDAALILYGNDEKLRRDRIARWRVRWVLWTADWIPTEFEAIDSTRFSKVDPLLWFSDAEQDSAMARAGVSLIRMNTWVDPAMHLPEIPRFDLTVVGPQNYERPDRPWRPALDTLLEEAWSYPNQGRRLATLYRVRTE